MNTCGCHLTLGDFEAVVERVVEEIQRLRACGKLGTKVSLVMDALFSFPSQLTTMKQKGIYACMGLKQSQVATHAVGLGQKRHRIIDRGGFIVTLFNDNSLVANATTVFERDKQRNSTEISTRQLARPLDNALVWFLVRYREELRDSINTLSQWAGTGTPKRVLAQIAAFTNVPEGELLRGMAHSTIAPTLTMREDFQKYVLVPEVCWNSPSVSPLWIEP